MKFEWSEVDSSIADGRPVWSLYLKWDGAYSGQRFSRIIGTMTKLSRAWRIMDINPGRKPDFYWLDGGLSLEDAQRAAKLFLCVGRDLMEKRT